MQKGSHRFILLFLFVPLLRIHAGQMSISPIPLIDQLPSNSVSRIFQDREGFIWFGTLDGVCRYDAYRILVFRSDLNNSNLLTNNKITCFAEDGNGRLLIGTQKGINILDKKNYRIRHWESEEIRDQWIKSMTVASDGSIWIGTLTQIYRYNPDLSLRKQYDNSLPASSINSIFEDATGDLWVALWRAGLYKYDAVADTFVRFPAIGKINNPFKIFQDNRKQHWIGTWGDGIYLFNPEKNGDEMYIHQEITGKERGSPENTFYSIVQDDVNNYIWLMSISGLYALQYTKEGNLKEVDVSYLFEESNNIFSEIIKDKTGNLWIAAFSEGAFTINFDKPVIENYPIPSIKKITGIAPNITAVFKDKDGVIWLNQNRWGLGWYDPRKNTIQFYNELPELRHFSDMGTVCCISGFRSIPDRIWVAPENESAIYCLKKEKGKIALSERIDLMKCSENSGNPRLFYEDRKNNIWIATTTRLLVKRFDKDEIEPVGFSFGSITGITEDTRGTLWISSKNAGIYRISPVGDLSVKNYNKETSVLSSNNITSICADLSGKIWIGTEEGNLIVYDAMEQTFQDVSKSFRMIGGGILNIVADDYGHIWVSTNKRITEYNPDNKSSRYYTVTDGVEITSFLSNSYYKDKSGKLFFGGNKGISVFTSSNALSGFPKNIKSIISDIKINYHSVFEGNNNRWFDIAEQVIHLEPEDKNIEIDFSSLDYTFSSKICYAYKMQGIDNDWVYAENNRQFAVYNQLKKGNYTFYIKATDENNLWSNEATQLKIYKHPAFYETNWAYMLYATLAILFVYLTFRIIRNRIKLKHALQIAQIEKDKSEELTHIKLRYFTNISHDFLTPLT
ncbi:Sensor histidine kinase TodS, partial [termite gut metagenome]